MDLNTQSNTKMSLIQRFFSFEGRFSRKQYIINNLLLISIGLVLLILFIVLGSLGATETKNAINDGVDISNNIFLTVGISIIILSVIEITAFVSLMSFTVRRLHDIGQSGWFSLLMLIPFATLIMVIVLSIKKGDIGNNKYGIDPILAIQLESTENPNTNCKV